MKRKILNRKKVNPSIPVYTGEKHLEKICLQLFKYNAEEYIEDPEFSKNSPLHFEAGAYQYWLNIHGIHDIDLIKNICAQLGVHELAIQDILDINQRPKFQEYSNYWFFTIKSILPFEDDEMKFEQLSFILGDHFLVSFQEKKADYFDHIRQRIREKIGIVRQRGTDYLLFLLFESILDNYFNTINSIEIKLDEINLLDIGSDPSPESLKSIETYKRQIHQIKKMIIPMKDFISRISREEDGFIQSKHMKYYHEIKDLCLSLIDDSDKIELKLDSYTNLFFSIQGHRMNQVMKTLTVVATIFIPLTFIAGIYGMNFDNMPELHWKWAYFGVWGVIILVFGGMLYYFKKKNWF